MTTDANRAAHLVWVKMGHSIVGLDGLVRILLGPTLGWTACVESMSKWFKSKFEYVECLGYMGCVDVKLV